MFSIPILFGYVKCVFVKLSKFSENLKKARAISGKTQLEVATLLGLEWLGYQRYEAGNREPNLSRLCQLADILNVSTDYLLGRTDDPTPPPSVN